MARWLSALLALVFVCGQFGIAPPAAMAAHGANLEGWQYVYQGTANDISGGGGPLSIDAASSPNAFLVLNGEQASSANKSHFGKTAMTDYTVEYDMVVTRAQSPDGQAGTMRWAIISYNDEHLGMESVHLYGTPSRTILNKEYVAGADFGQLGSAAGPTFMDGQLYHFKIQKAGATLNVTMNGSKIIDNATLPAHLGTNGTLSQDMTASGYVGFQLDHLQAAIANVKVTNDTSGYSETFFSGNISTVGRYGAGLEGWQYVYQGAAGDLAQTGGSGPLTVSALNSENAFLVLNGEGAEDANKTRFGKSDMDSYTVEYDWKAAQVGTAGSANWALISYNDYHLGIESMQVEGKSAQTTIAKEYVAGADYGAYGTATGPAMLDGKLYHVVIRKAKGTVNVTINGRKAMDNIALPTQLGTNGTLSQNMTGSGYVGFQFSHLNGTLANVKVTNEKTGYTQTFFAGNVNASGYGANIEGWQYIGSSNADISQEAGSGALIVDAAGSSNAFLVLNGEQSASGNRTNFGKANMTNYTVEYDAVISRIYQDGGGSGSLRWAIVSYSDTHLGTEAIQLKTSASQTIIDKEYVAGADFGQYGSTSGASLADGQKHHIQLKKAGSTLNVTVDGTPLASNVTLPTHLGTNGTLSQDMTGSSYVGLQLDHLQAKIGNVKVTNDTTGYTETFFKTDVLSSSGSTLEGWKYTYQGTSGDIAQQGGSGPLSISAYDSDNDFLILNADAADSGNKALFPKAGMTNYTVEYDLKVTRMRSAGSFRWAIISYSDTHLGLEGMHVLGVPTATVINKEYVAGADFGQYGGTAAAASFTDGKPYHFVMKKNGASFSATMNGVKIFDNVSLPAKLGTNGTNSQDMRASGYVGFQLDHMDGVLSNVKVTNDTTGVSQTYFADTLTPATTYYVSASGSDSNDGRSPATPFKTAAPINAITLRPGDSVLFKRGDTFTNLHLQAKGSGKKTKGDWITLGAYGTGSNPLFQDGGTAEAAISLSGGETYGGYKIQNIDVDHYMLGFSAKKVGSAVFDGLQIANCSFTNITTNAAFQDPANLPEGAPLAWGMWLRLVRNVDVSNVTTNNTDSPAQIIGNLVTIDGFNADGSKIQGLMLYSSDSNADLNKIDGKILLKNSKFLHTGKVGAPFGTTGVLIENTRDTILKNIEVAYTANDGQSFDSVAIDWEEANLNCIIDGAYVHDNDGPFLLAMEHPDSLGFSKGNIVKNSVSINNGKRDITAEATFIAQSSYNNADQKIAVQNTIDIGMPGSVPYTLERVKASSLPTSRFNTVGYTSGTAAVGEFFDEDGLGSFVNTSGASVSNSHLTLASGSQIRTAYSGAGYIVNTYLKGAAGLVFLSPDSNNGYEWTFSSGQLSAYKRVSGTLTKLKDVSVSGFDPASWFRVRVETGGGVIRTYLNERLVDTLNDSTFTSGAVGFRASGAAQADNLLVYKYESNARPATDVSIANAAPGGTLTFAGTGWHAAEQNWTAGPGIASYRYEPFGVGYAEIGGANAYIQRNSVSVNVSGGYNKVNVLLYNATTSPLLTVEFSTDGGATWNSKTVNVRAKSSETDYPFSLMNPPWKNYVVDMSAVPAWSGTINGLRIKSGATEGSFSVSQVVISK